MATAKQTDSKRDSKSIAPYPYQYPVRTDQPKGPRPVGAAGPIGGYVGTKGTGQ